MYGNFFKFDKNGMPQWDADFSKIYSDFDPMKVTEQLVAAMKDTPASGVGLDAVIEIQQKNLEALNKASQTALQGAQEIAQKQSEVFQDAFAQAQAAAEALGAASTPEELTAKQADLYKSAFEKALANAQEVSDAVTKANEAAVKVIGDRIAEALNEVQTQAAKATGGKK